MGSEGRIKVGIFFNARQEQGGLYQYALTLVDCLAQYAPEFEYILVHATLEPLPLSISAKNWHVLELPKPAVQFRMALELVLFHISRAGIHLPFTLIPAYPQINKADVDVMIYVKPTPHVFQWRYPAIFPIHDLQHRLQRQFPEVSAKGEFKRREILYKESIKHAQAILTDSETGKEDVIQLYGTAEKLIHALPYIAPTFRDTSESGVTFETLQAKLGIPEGYFFYPAAFWPHKNHIRLIQSIRQMADQHGVKIPLVLSGSKKREYDDLVLLAESLGLRDVILFVGFVSDDELLLLYQHALALVMPTFFGPTNIPILEAWQAGCPVITSDIRGIREQVGDAGLLVNPLNVQAMADAMWRVFQEPQLRHKLVEKGKSRVQSWTPEMFGRRLAEIIQQICQKKFPPDLNQ
jgi:glycosyltransferase involved in cell wall biosynthesis